MHAYQADTMTDLHTKLCQNIVLAPKNKLDVITTADVQIHNTMAYAKSMDWEFDLKNLWLTKSRWTMMARQYIDPEELKIWIERSTGRVGLRGRGVSLMRTRIVKPRGGAATGHTNQETRRWGSCMLAISYKALPRPQITLYSRTCYLGYLSGLDLTVAWQCGRYLAHEMGIDVKDISFLWMNEAQQYHNFKSLAFLLNHVDEDQRDMYRGMMLNDKVPKKYKDTILQSPALLMSRRWMLNMLKLDRDGATLGDMSYNTYRRIRRRYHTEVLGYDVAQRFEGWSKYKQGPQKGEDKEYFKAYQPLPHTYAVDLDFSPIGMPLGQTWGADFDPEAAMEDDLDDDE